MVSGGDPTIRSAGHADTDYVRMLTKSPADASAKAHKRVGLGGSTDDTETARSSFEMYDRPCVCGELFSQRKGLTLFMNGGVIVMGAIVQGEF